MKFLYCKFLIFCMVLSNQRTPYSIMYVWAAFEAKSPPTRHDLVTLISNYTLYTRLFHDFWPWFEPWSQSFLMPRNDNELNLSKGLLLFLLKFDWNLGSICLQKYWFEIHGHQGRRIKLIKETKDGVRCHLTKKYNNKNLKPVRWKWKICLNWEVSKY